MNGYSLTVQQWTNARLLAEHSKIAPAAKYAGPAADIHYLYAAILEEMKRRNLLRK